MGELGGAMVSRYLAKRYSVALEVFLDEINIWIGELWVKQTDFYNVGEPHPVS